MDKLRSGEFTRKVGSFLLAVGLHALILLIHGSGYWASGDELGFTLIQPQLIEIEPVRKEARTQPQKPPSTPKPTASAAKTPPTQEQPAPPPVEKPLTSIEEVHQENPAPRETRTEPGEVATGLEVAESSEETGKEPSPVTNGGSTESEGDPQAEGETETNEPAVPALPPLGAAGGMAGAVPRFTYPKGAEHLGLEGRVLMEIYLSPDGTFLKDPVMLASSGHEALDDHCRRMFTSREWKFKPAAQPYKLQVEVGYKNYEVTIDFLGEAAYLSPEEGGELIE
ncbi:MAG: TonB family protein [Firmicutes bacterium]|nr:TonB family protein [Bacillota bacterium]